MDAIGKSNQTAKTFTDKSYNSMLLICVLFIFSDKDKGQFQRLLLVSFLAFKERSQYDFYVPNICSVLIGGKNLMMLMLGILGFIYFLR